MELKYHREIVIHSLDNIFQTFPSEGRGLGKYLDFIALTPLKDDILASDHTHQKKGTIHPENNETGDRGGPVVCYWEDHYDFHDLMPKRPQVMKLKLGPWPAEPVDPDQVGSISSAPRRLKDQDGRWYNTLRQKDKDGRWIWDSPSIPTTTTTRTTAGLLPEESKPGNRKQVEGEDEKKAADDKWDCDLEEGVEYEIRLSDGMYVKWWKTGEKDDHLTIYKREGNWIAQMLGMKEFRRWKGDEVMDEREWIEIVMEGEAPRIGVGA